MEVLGMATEFGVGKGKVFPADKAGSLVMPLRRLVQSPTKLADRLDVASDGWVLEVGCGPGYFSPALAARIPDGQLVVVDLQWEMLQLARVRLDGCGEVVQGDAQELPLRSASFDAVVVILVLGEVPDQGRFLGEVRRVLRPGGAALFAETRRDSDFIRFADLCALVEPHGFKLIGRWGWSWEYSARFAAI